MVCMARLYGRAGRLPALFGGFWPGQFHEVLTAQQTGCGYRPLGSMGASRGQRPEERRYGASYSCQIRYTDDGPGPPGVLM